MKRTIFISLFLVWVALSFANRIVAKDSTPGGLYIIGPDVSSDSTDLTFLYYSPDAGTTLVVRDTLNWAYIYELAVDYSPETVYVSKTTPGLYWSTNGGNDWEIRYSVEPISNLRGGAEPGYLLRSGAILSEDYGLTWYFPMAQGWFGLVGGKSELGYDNFGYAQNTEGVVFTTPDKFENLDSVYWFPSIAFFFRGAEFGEVYAHYDDSIFFSSNNGYSWLFKGLLPSFTIGSYTDDGYELQGGRYSGQIFCVVRNYNFIEMVGVFGGSIEIWLSEDYGETWNLVKKYGDKIYESSILEYQDFKIFPNPFTAAIETDNPIIIYSLSGRKIIEGKGKINLSSLTIGVYLAIGEVNEKKLSKKILKIK